MNARIVLFFSKLFMTHDHIADLSVITIQSAGKHLLRKQFCLPFCLRTVQKFLIKSCIILIHASLFCLTHGKNFHMITIIGICLRLSLFIAYNTCIDECFLVISKRCIVICEIHQNRLRKFSLIRSIHCFHIILIQSCQTDSFLHCQRKPSEIFLFPRISEHDISADCFQCIIRFKGIVSQRQCSVHTSAEFSLISGKISKSHHQFFCQKTFLTCKQKHLRPETAHSMQKRRIITDIIPRFKIKERTSTSPVKKLLHHKNKSGR